MTQPLHRRSNLYAVAAYLLAVALVVSSVWRAAPVFAASAVQTTTQELLIVSYGDASSWLDTLPPEDRTDQIRDYAVLGLAGILGLDVQELRDAFFDQTPVRDPLFWDLARSRSGPGRSVIDGEDTLHILAPQDDPALARTIGLALDDHRKDAGSDPRQVVIYLYTIDSVQQQVLLDPQPPQRTATVRKAYGYVEKTVTSLRDLQAFLAQARHLSQVSVASGVVRVGGWNWPDVPTGDVTAEDLAVLQRGYLTHARRCIVRHGIPNDHYATGIRHRRRDPGGR